MSFLTTLFRVIATRPGPTSWKTAVEVHGVCTGRGWPRARGVRGHPGQSQGRQRQLPGIH